MPNRANESETTPAGPAGDAGAAEVICRPPRGAYLWGILEVASAMVFLASAVGHGCRYLCAVAPGSEGDLVHAIAGVFLAFMFGCWAQLHLRKWGALLVAREDGLEIRKAWRGRTIAYEDIRSCKLDRGEPALIDRPTRLTLVLDTARDGTLRFPGSRWRPEELKVLGLFVRAKLRRMPSHRDESLESRRNGEGQ